MRLPAIVGVAIAALLLMYAAATSADTSAPRLTGTLTSPSAPPQCVIDNSVYSTGESAGQWRVLRIERGRVTLEGPSGTITLTVSHR